MNGKVDNLLARIASYLTDYTDFFDDSTDLLICDDTDL